VIDLIFVVVVLMDAFEFVWGAFCCLLTLTLTLGTLLLLINRLCVSLIRDAAESRYGTSILRTCCNEVLAQLDKHDREQRRQAYERIQRARADEPIPECMKQYGQE